MKGKRLLLSVTLVSQLILSSCSREPADYLNNGIKEFESGDYDSAIANLRRAKYLMPESFEANLYLGKAFLKNPAATDAQYKARYYLNTAKDSAKTAQNRFDVGMTLLGIYMNQKDYPKIIKEGNALVKGHKALLDRNKAYEIQTVIANAYFHNKDYEEAAETLEYLIKSYEAELSANEEGKARAYMQLAAAIIKSDGERSGDCFTYLTTVRDLQKDSFSREYKRLAGECYEMIGDQFQAENNYHNSKGFYQKAEAFYASLGDCQKQEIISSKIQKAALALDKRCDGYACLMRRGERELAGKDYDGAAAYFQKAEQKGATNAEKAQALAKLGIAYFLDGEEKSALAQFTLLKSNYGREYKKLNDRDSVDLFMGAALILTAEHPDALKNKLVEKANRWLPGRADEKDAAAVFKDNIELGKSLIESSTEGIGRKGSPDHLNEAAEVCGRVGDRFADWKMPTDAKDFYERAKSLYERVFDKDKVIELNKRIDKLA